jgi:pimeloyl-ACP methyl ester carboxylesterase
MPEISSRKPNMSPILRLMRAVFSMLGPVFPGFTGNWAYRIWFTPMRFKTPQYEMQSYNSANRSALDVNGTPVAIFSWGEGPTILFIHGWGGRGTQITSFIDSLVSAGYRIISFDAPAHGDTPGKQTNILEFADVVLEMEKKFGPFYGAITHSFGGMILAYVMNLGVKFERTVTLCPPANNNTLIANFSRALNIPDAPITVMLNRLENTFGKDIYEKISTINNVKTLTNRALIIHDENDEDIPWQSGQSVADAWQGSKFIRTRGLGHRRILRDPDVIRISVDFITI